MFNVERILYITYLKLFPHNLFKFQKVKDTLHGWDDVLKACFVYPAPCFFHPRHFSLPENMNYDIRLYGDRIRSRTGSKGIVASWSEQQFSRSKRNRNSRLQRQPNSEGYYVAKISFEDS